MKYTAASFFSGIGGLDLAFSWTGFDIRVQVEIDSYCRKVLWKNRQYWINAKQFKDIKNVKKSQVGHVDVMFGGFPCTDISIAGKQAGVTKQTRSGLWFELLRLIGQVRPRVIVLENVANITRVGGTVVTASLAEAGYDAIWLPLRAADIGAPHQRERWFCVGYARRISKPTFRKKATRQKPYTYRSGKLGYTTSQPSYASAHYIRKFAQSKEVSKPRNAGGASGQVVNATRTRLQGCHGNKPQRSIASRPNRRQRYHKRTRPQSRLGGTIARLPGRLDGHRGQFPAAPNQAQYGFEPSRVTDRKPYRRDRLKALGNAVVPQQALPIAQAVKQFLDLTT